VNDNRTHQRKTSALPVKVQVKDRSYAGSITDISPGGAYIEIQEPMEIGYNIMLQLETLSADEPFLVKGEVTSSRSDGFGVKFQGLSEQQQNMLSFLYW
jgi:Tfp pilus assembly protein PilZ